MSQKLIDSYVTAKSWCTSGIHHQEQPIVNAHGDFFADGTLIDVCVVYDIYHKYTSQKIPMTAYDCAGMCQVYKTDKFQVSTLSYPVPQNCTPK